MAKIDEILRGYIEKRTHEREIGRYWATDCYKILKGYLTPENFFEKPEINERGVKMMLTGLANELMLEKVFGEMNLDFQSQVKKEIEIAEDIVLVSKVDFLFPSFAIETKFPFSFLTEIPYRYKLQLECEYRSFYVPIYLGILETPFNLRLIEYTPMKSRWRKIKNLLIEFDKKLREKYGKTKEKK